MPERTWRRWQAKARAGGRPKGPWPRPARVTARDRVLRHALAHPAWGHRKVWAMTRHDGHVVSEATVLRLLRDEGLIQSAQYQRERRRLASTYTYPADPINTFDLSGRYVTYGPWAAVGGHGWRTTQVKSVKPEAWWVDVMSLTYKWYSVQFWRGRSQSFLAVERRLVTETKQLLTCFVNCRVTTSRWQYRTTFQTRYRLEAYGFLLLTGDTPWEVRLMLIGPWTYGKRSTSYTWYNPLA